MKKKVFICVVVFVVSVTCIKANNGNTACLHAPGKERVIKKNTSFVSAPTDYFRSVASGNWSNVSIWESSNDSASWTGATAVPGALAAHVVIQAPDSVYLTAGTTTINLSIMPGAKMDAGAFTMTVSNRFNLLGNAIFYQGGTVLPVPGTEQVLDPASTYYYNGTQVGLNASYPEFGNLVFMPAPTGSGTFQNSNAAAPFFNGLVVRGDMTINLRVTWDINFASGSTVSRTHTIDGNLHIIGGNSIVALQKGAAGSATTGTVNIGGDLDINGGSLYALGLSAANTGNAIINLNGNINDTLGILSITPSLVTAGSYTFNFIGASPQSVNNDGVQVNIDMQHVNVNNSTGVVFNNPLEIYGGLNLVAGIIKTTDINLLTMAAGSTVAGASNTAYVDGPVKKIGDTDFTFPVGKTGFGYVPTSIGVFFGGTVNDEFTAEYRRGSARQLGPVAAGPGLVRVSNCDYWTLDKGISTPISLDVTGYWSPNNTCIGTYIDNPDSVTIAHFNGTNWNSYAVTPILTPGSTSATGSVTWPGASEFSPFALASTSVTFNPLPITINYLNGSKQNDVHVLNWKVTCNNTTGVTMNLERSTDGINYSSIYSITATALRCQQPFDHTDLQPPKGMNYYRIRFTAPEAATIYSKVVGLLNAVNGVELMSIAPNPVVNGTCNLHITAAEKTQLDLFITDIQGRIIQKRSVNLAAGFNSILMDVRNLAAGTYQLFGNSSTGRTKLLRFVTR